MNWSKLSIPALFVLFCLSPLAQATDLLVTSSALTTADPTQLGRLNRNGLISTWSNVKAFPGVLSSSTSFRYRAFTINPGASTFVQVFLDEPSRDLFVSAYVDAFVPADLSSGYLGDSGDSGYNFNDPRYFQVVVPAGRPLVIVVGDATANGAGVGKPFRLHVEGFLDTQYTSGEKITPTLSISNSPRTYNGTQQAASVSAGAVPGIVSNVKYNGSSTVPKNAGTYAITADFVPTDVVSYSSLTGASAGNFVINAAAVTATAGSGFTIFSGVAQSPSPCTVTGAYTTGISCVNNPSSAIFAASYPISPVMQFGSELATNFVVTPVNGTFVISERSATVRYIGQTAWVTSGSSSTTAQVTLSASVADATGLDLSSATMTFKDAADGTILAQGVRVSPVAGSPGSGTANTVVTLSTGQFGAAAYLIEVLLTGNYTNADQRLNDYQSTTGTLTVARPGTANTTILGGTISALSSRAGTYAGSNAVSTVTAGLQYNRSGANLKGQILVAVPQGDGSIFYIKSNSLSSMTIDPQSPKKATIYSKASVFKIYNGVVMTIDGNVSLRLDVVDSPAGADQVGITVLSSKDSSLLYSNNWQNPGSGWRTVPADLATGSGTLIQ